MSDYIMVCTADTPPVAPASCPVESIKYVPNLWDSGLTMDQTSTLMAMVVALWAVAWVFVKVRRAF